MKALSIRPPWSLLILVGLKDVENRTWPTSYRGPILIHSSGTYDRQGHLYLLNRPDLVSKELAAQMILWALTHKGIPEFVATAELVDCRRGHASKWAQAGAWHWVLGDVKPLRDGQRIRYPGRQGLFQAPAPDDSGLYKPHDGTTRRVDVRVEVPDVMVTRPGRWGNPWRIRQQKGRTRKVWEVWYGADAYLGTFTDKADATYWAVKGYGLHLQKHPELVEAAKKELRGKRLGCFCRAGEACHGDVLVELLERGRE